MSLKSLAAGTLPQARPHCGRSQRSPRPLVRFKGIAFQYFHTTKSWTISQISLSKNARKLTYDHDSTNSKFVRGVTLGPSYGGSGKWDRGREDGVYLEGGKYASWANRGSGWTPLNEIFTSNERITA